MLASLLDALSCGSRINPVTLSCTNAHPTCTSSCTAPRHEKSPSVGKSLTPVSCLDRHISASEVDLNDLSTLSSSTCPRPDQVIPALQHLEVDEVKTDDRLEEEAKAFSADIYPSLPAPNGQTGPSFSPSLAQYAGFEGNREDGGETKTTLIDPLGHIMALG